MLELPIPIWMLQAQQTDANRPNNPCDLAGQVVAFSDTAKAAQFLMKRREGRWTLDMLRTRSGLFSLISDLHTRDIEAICLDPEVDGTGGTKVTLVDLLKQFNQKG